jgi:sulfide:quinone oxidoreductase
MAKILILGGGFAVVAAAEGLNRGIGDQDELVVVSKSEKFIFYPGLVPLVFNKVKFKEISFDLSRALEQRKIRFVRGEAIELDQKRRKVRLVDGPDEEIVNYDYLLIAVGRKIRSEAIPGFDEYSNHLLNAESALLFKQAMAEFDEGSIVVGLCPGASLPLPMCESALGLADRFRRQIMKRSDSVKLVFTSSM